MKKIVGIIVVQKVAEQGRDENKEDMCKQHGKLLIYSFLYCHSKQAGCILVRLISWLCMLASIQICLPLSACWPLWQSIVMRLAASA